MTAEIRDPKPRAGPPRGWAHLVVPGCLSALLFVIAFPLIMRLNPRGYRAATDQSENPYLWRWLVLSAAMFLISAAWYWWRLRRERRRFG